MIFYGKNRENAKALPVAHFETIQGVNGNEFIGLALWI